jgi:hypothetical protein
MVEGASLLDWAFHPFGWLNERGNGINVFQHPGLTPTVAVKDIAHFPFSDCCFDSVTLIANMNHIPELFRDTELSEGGACSNQATLL